MPDYGGYWNILEKLGALQNCDDTPCGSRPLILGLEKDEGSGCWQMPSGRGTWRCTDTFRELKKKGVLKL